jgi:hypothetical protein
VQRPPRGRHPCLRVLVGLLLTLALCAGEVLLATDPRLVWEGRVRRGAATVSFDYANVCVSISVQRSGTEAVRVAVTHTGAARFTERDTMGDTLWSLQVDGALQPRLYRTPTGPRTFALPLPASLSWVGVRTLRWCKESQPAFLNPLPGNSTVTVQAVAVTGAVVLPAPARRTLRIEVSCCAAWGLGD